MGRGIGRIWEIRMKLDTIRLLVDDMPAAVRFYRDALGLAMRFGSENDVYVEFDSGVGGIAVALFDRKLMLGALGDDTGQTAAGHRSLLTFLVPAVDQTYASLVAAGAKAVHPPTDQPAWHLRAAHVSDPAGNLVEIHSALSSG
jgi:lactoylglutathione lyase